MRYAILFRLVAVLAVSAALPAAGPAVRAQESVTFTVTVRVFNCAPGMTADPLVGEDCAPTTEGFDVAIGSLEGPMTPLTLADASLDGSAYTWTLGTNRPDHLTPSPNVGPRWTIGETVLPDGYTNYVAVGDGVAPNPDGGYVFRTTRGAPDVFVTIYNFAPAVQPGEDTFNLGINAVNCTSKPTGAFLREPTPECSPGVGIWFEASGPDGTVYGDCVTALVPNGLSGGCSIPVPYGTTVTVTEDEDTIPAGYIPVQNPLTIDLPPPPPEGEVGPLEAFVNLPQPAAQEWTLTVRSFACPPGYGGDDWAAACAAPLPDVAFTSLALADDAEPQPFATGDDGTVTLGLDGASLGNAVTVTMPEGYDRFAVYCTANRGQETGVRVNDDSAVLYQLSPGDVVLCDWYFVPLAGEQTASPGGTALPDPVAGRPAHVHPGTCGKLRRQDSYDLTDLTAPPGAAEGSRRATVAEASFTVLDVSLDDLLATAHAINVHASHDAMGVYVVCGEIGGARGADGALAVGLREVNGSGYEGIAYLEPDATDSARTGVWVFVAPTLAEEERPTAVPAASPTAGTPVASPMAE